MVYLLLRNKDIRYVDMIIRDLGYSLTCSFSSPIATFSVGDEISVKDSTTSYDFLVSKTKGQFISAKLKSLEKIKNNSVGYSSDKGILLKELFTNLRISNSFDSTYNGGISNFGFSGTVSELLSFLSFQYSLKYYLTNSGVVFYRNTKELIKNKITKIHSNLKVLEGQSLLVNLSVRAFDYISNNEIKEVIHLVNKGLTMFKYK